MVKNVFNFKPLLLGLSCSLFFSCAKQGPKKPDENSFEGLRALAGEYVEKNKPQLAIDSLEKMMEMYPDNSQISKYRLELADLYFAKKNYESAYTYYKHFYKLNPSDSKTEYANRQGILCKFYQAFGVKRDPSNIQKALNKCKIYLANHDFKDQNLKKEIEDILYTCNKMLVDHEVYIYKFYLRKGKIKSAENRLKYIKEELAPKNPDLEPQILYLEAKLNLKKKEADKVQEKAQLLAQNYPDSKFVDMANRLAMNKRKIAFPF